MFVKDSVFLNDVQDSQNGRLPGSHFDNIQAAELSTTTSPSLSRGSHADMPLSSFSREVDDGHSLGGRAAGEESVFIDEFGFLLNEEQKKRELLYTRSIDGRQILRREVKWANMAADWDKTRLKQYQKLKKRCRKGIPPRFRSVAWQLLTGSRKQMLDTANRDTYSSLLTKKLADEELEHLIERDLARTFPTNVIFMEEGGVGQKFLWNVLRAYAGVDPEVGYVQGMGFVVAALSTQLGEEETFWMLHSLMNNPRYNLRELYRPRFPMLQQFFYQLKQLMKRLLPKLHRHFENLGVDPAFYASQWFLTLFVYHFDFRLVLRVWDIFMSEGWKIIFRLAIALLKSEEKQLLAMDFNETLPALKSLHKGKDPDKLISRAQAITFKTSELHGYGADYWHMMKEER